MTRRFCCLIALAVALSPLIGPLHGDEAESNRVTVRGKVVPLQKLLAEAGSDLDRDAAPFWLGLVTDEGKVYPIVKDDGGRRFFKDEGLLNREVEVTGRLFGDTSMIQVSAVYGVRDDQLTELFYWCDICSIKRYELNECECCGGPMIFKEMPLGR